MNVDLTDPKFHDENAAREWLEEARWQGRPWCPHCGSFEVNRMEACAERQKKTTGHRAGLFHCPDCRGQFTVRTGQVMERSHVPLAKWVLAWHLMAASKKGVSAHQLHRTLKVAYNTAWFMAHRIREAMDESKTAGPLGGPGKVVEADEMYHGKRETPVQGSRNARKIYTKRGKSGGAQKRQIVGLVERGGAARMEHMNRITSKNLREFVVRNADRKSRLHTDESNLYTVFGAEFVKHETVNHGAKEYARGDVTTNSVEGMFGIFKRGMIGIYQHCGEQHLQRYLNEFSFRYSYRAKLGVGDAERAVLTMQGGEGKRLAWRRIDEA